jgi:hypothetical protein
VGFILYRLPRGFGENIPQAGGRIAPHGGLKPLQIGFSRTAG